LKTLSRPAPRRFALLIAALQWLLPDAAHAAAVESQAQVLIQAPVDRIWELLIRVDEWPRWNKAVQSSELQGPFATGSTFVWRSEGFTVTSMLRDIEVPKRLTWTGKAFGTNAVHRWELEETPDGVVVRTSETFDGWLPALMPDTMQRKLDSTLPRWLTALKLAAEGKNSAAVWEPPRGGAGNQSDPGQSAS